MSIKLVIFEVRELIYDSQFSFPIVARVMDLKTSKYYLEIRQTLKKIIIIHFEVSL